MNTDTGFEWTGAAGDPIKIDHLALSSLELLHEHIEPLSDVFIADLHLSVDTPKLNQAFESLLDQLIQTQPQHLYIMGDWFNAWLGHDIEMPWFDSIAASVRTLSKKTHIYVLPGNRDFAINQKFLSPLGAELMSDPMLLRELNQNTILSHGDRYCTGDVGYQRMKKVLTNPWVLGLLRASPKRFRLKLSEWLRGQSKARTRIKAQSIMDVEQSAIERQFKLDQENRPSVLIHGHTHRPGLHQCGSNARIVLGDWYVDRQQVHTQIAIKTGSHFTLLKLEL
jgi:UDP-2,3-diacylglucosamine hydrolase